MKCSKKIKIFFFLVSVLSHQNLCFSNDKVDGELNFSTTLNWTITFELNDFPALKPHEALISRKNVTQGIASNKMAGLSIHDKIQSCLNSMAEVKRNISSQTTTDFLRGSIFCFPFEMKDVETHLSELAAINFYNYVKIGRQYISINEILQPKINAILKGADSNTLKNVLTYKLILASHLNYYRIFLEGLSQEQHHKKEGDKFQKKIKRLIVNTNKSIQIILDRLSFLDPENTEIKFASVHFLAASPSMVPFEDWHFSIKKIIPALEKFIVQYPSYNELAYSDLAFYYAYRGNKQKTFNTLSEGLEEFTTLNRPAALIKGFLLQTSETLTDTDEVEIYSDIIKHLQFVLDTKGISDEDKIILARAYFELKKYQLGFNVLKKINKDSFESLMGKGLCLLYLDKDMSRFYFKKAILMAETNSQKMRATGALARVVK